MSPKYKIAFFGTPEIAVPSLQALINHPDFEIKAVITQPDQKVGRKQVITASPVKENALKNNLEVFQPEKLSKDLELLEHLESLDLDFLVVIAYGQILNQRTLNIPKIAPINIHGSILPHYRGASPIEQALLNGDSETGLSIMKMSLAMDQGPVYQIHQLPIEITDNNSTLRTKMANLSAEKLATTLIKIASNQLTATEQNHQQASYCQKITKQDGLIDLKFQSATEIFNKFRAYYTWPGITWNYKNKNFKLLNLVINHEINLAAETIKADKNTLLIGTKAGTIEILEIQMEGKKPLKIKDFLSGYLSFFQ